MELEEFGAYLKALPAKIESAAPAVVAETAVEYYKERFKEKAFDGAPWVPGRPKKSGSLLVQSGNLMNSIRPDRLLAELIAINPPRASARPSLPLLRATEVARRAPPIFAASTPCLPLPHATAGREWCCLGISL